MSDNTNLALEKQMTASPVEVPDIANLASPSKAGMDISFLKEVPVTIAIEIGRVQMNIEEVLLFGTGTMVTLKKQINEPIDLLINGKLVGHGDIVAIDDNFGIRITEILEPGMGI